MFPQAPFDFPPGGGCRGREATVNPKSAKHCLLGKEFGGWAINPGMRHKDYPWISVIIFAIPACSAAFVIPASAFAFLSVKRLAVSQEHSSHH